MKLKNNLTIESQMQEYSSKGFYPNQCSQIRLGLESSIDASRYARTDIDYRNMEELRYELEEQKEASY